MDKLVMIMKNWQIDVRSGFLLVGGDTYVFSLPRRVYLMIVQG
jgi:hypothetical protein